MHGARGDGEAQAGPARLALARVLDPVERTEDFLNGLLGHAGPVVAHADDGAPFCANRLAAESDLDLRPLGRVRDGVADDVLDGAAEQLDGPARVARLAGRDAHKAAARL